MRLEALPSTPLPLFNGGAPPPPGEKAESVLLYRNGGVGALNDMGTQEAALRPERWSWVVVSRKPGELRTYVNGRLCAAVKLEPPKETKAAATAKARGQAAAEGGEGEDGGEGERGGAAAPKPQLQEKFVLDPQHLALFAADEGGGGKEAAEVQGLHVKYLRVTSKVWSPQEIAEELHKLRSADEEAEVVAAARGSRAEQLALQPLYASPPPLWLHPAFAAEFADPFIADTPFEQSAMHVSLEVLVLVLDRLLEPGGGGH